MKVPLVGSENVIMVVIYHSLNGDKGNLIKTTFKLLKALSVSPSALNEKVENQLGQLLCYHYPSNLDNS